MVAFRSGPRPSGKNLKEAVEKLKSKTKIGKGRKIIKEDPDKDEKKSKPVLKPLELQKKEAYEQKQNKEGRIIGGDFYPKMAKGGRAGFKSGSKGCKLATKGKGRAYGKNS